MRKQRTQVARLGWAAPFLLGLWPALTPCGIVHAATTEAAQAAQNPDAGAAEGRLDCLPQRTMDLGQLLRAQRFAGQRDTDGGVGSMTPITRGSPRWMSGFNAVLAWQNDDCPAFAAFAEHMGYDAVEVRDARSGSRHFVLTEKARRFNGLFVLRAPSERDSARPFLITATHRSAPTDIDSLVQLYLGSNAVALLVNSAHPCSLKACGGCIMGNSETCGGCTRASDAAASSDNLQFGLFSALVAIRRDFRIEYDSLGTPLPNGCRSLTRLGQGPALPANATQAEPVVADALWRGLQARAGAACVCFDEREPGCAGSSTRADTIYGRLANEEPLRPFDPCGQAATQRSGRYLHIATRGLPGSVLAAALADAWTQATRKPAPK